MLSSFSKNNFQSQHYYELVKSRDDLKISTNDEPFLKITTNY
jgi:hypothetical protein